MLQATVASWPICESRGRHDRRGEGRGRGAYQELQRLFSLLPPNNAAMARGPDAEMWVMTPFTGEAPSALRASGLSSTT